MADGAGGGPACAGPCKGRLGEEGRVLRLTLPCRDCGGRGQLSDPRCLRGALEVLARERGVDTLILSGHTETQFRGGAMAALEGLVALAGDLEHLASRPAPASHCARCGARPEALFLYLREVLLADPGALPGALRSCLERVGAACTRPPAAGCAACLSDTAGDLSHASAAFEELVRSVVKRGFKIVM